MQDLTNTQAFSYTASVKLPSGSDKIPALAAAYPGVTDISVVSRKFIDYDECITSGKRLMTDMKDQINLVSAPTVFTVSSEINPDISGSAALSKDWDKHEVARLWIFDEKMAGTGRIYAVGQARIFQTEQNPNVRLHN